MGQATILENLGGCLYRVKMVKDETRLTDRKAKIVTRLVELSDLIDDAEGNADSALAAYQLAVFDVNYAISNKLPAADLSSAQTAAVKANTNYVVKMSVWRKLKLERTSLEKEQEQIEAALADDIRELWCTDYTDDLSGTVDTIEINSDPDDAQIAPGGSGKIGKVQDALAGTPAGVAYNMALLPLIQRIKPTFRWAAIKSLYTIQEEADVILAREGSYAGKYVDSAYFLPINTDPPDSTITPPQLADYGTTDVEREAAHDKAVAGEEGDIEIESVPIEYDQGVDLFGEGDEVVLAFDNQDWSSPKIIGFYGGPAGGIGYVCKIVDPLHLRGDISEAGINQYTNGCFFVRFVYDPWYPLYGGWIAALVPVDCRVSVNGEYVRITPLYTYTDNWTDPANPVKVSIPRNTKLIVKVLSSTLIAYDGFTNYDTFYRDPRAFLETGTYEVHFYGGGEANTTYSGEYYTWRAALIALNASLSLEGGLPWDDPRRMTGGDKSGSINAQIKPYYGPHTIEPPKLDFSVRGFSAGNPATPGWVILPAEYNYWNRLVMGGFVYIRGGTGVYGYDGDDWPSDVVGYVQVNAGASVSGFPWIHPWHGESGVGDYDQDLNDLFSGKPMGIGSSGYFAVGRVYCSNLISFTFNSWSPQCSMSIDAGSYATLAGTGRNAWKIV